MTTTSPTASQALPRWEVATVFPSLDSAEFDAAVERALGELRALAELFDARGVARAGGTPTEESAPVLEEALSRLNSLLEQFHTLFAYTEAFVTTDSRDELAQRRLSELLGHEVALTKLDTRLTAWIGTLDVERLVADSQIARAHAFALRRAAEAAGHLMSEPEEDLAAELDVTGGVAWQKLYDDVTSQILVPFDRDGESRELPVSELRALAHEPDRETRRRAYEAELEAWARTAVPLAAAMNSIKGQTNTLSARRAWPSALAQSTWANHLDPETLDAMVAAIRAALPDLRRYLRAKARALGVDGLAWYDLFAPLPTSAGANGHRVWTFDDARDFVLDQFGTYSARLRDYAARAFAERWIDAEPRAGKVDGAFCMRLRGEESRVLMNFSPSHRSVTTLAHELGHAYHVHVSGDLPPLRRRTPSTLAETASTFCEVIVRNAALAAAEPSEQLAIVEGSLQDAVGILVDTTSRFFFERRVLERRRERELSVRELCDLMREAQVEAYGDGLDPDALHPYMWAAKPHYYGSRAFYNFPYSFGLLFGLGLYGRYVDDPDGFRGRYDDLLASTGTATAAELGDRFGIDVRSHAFWRRSLDVVVADVDRFGRLLADGGA